jgi:hypothetical protein
LLNTITRYETKLGVEDKTIILATSGTPATAIVDGVDNEGSGVIVDGFPADVAQPADAETARKYEKSVKWHNNSGGIDAMRTPLGMLDEAFWEVRGGALRLTSPKPDGKEISYGFRINENEELEVVKRWVDGSNVERAVAVATFGHSNIFAGGFPGLTGT